MTTEPTHETSAIVPSPTDALVEPKPPERNDDVKHETQALIDAIKKRAQSEIQSAGDLTRDAYLNAVRQAREAIENDKLIDRDRIEHSFQHIQQEAEKNWTSVVQEMESFGTRLSEAAKTAWDKLLHGKSTDHHDSSPPSNLDE
ncbi:hypothetical protein ACN4EK_30145 [Pantanalinema rosaneae CENA516]|uniref:hypothetical protein n=1 Tax=Pantanalinema rosaneae TaxID=1620701 RepID=UPI003D6F2D00